MDGLNSTCYNFDNTWPTVMSQIMLSTVIVTLNFMVVTIIVINPRETRRKPAFVFMIGLAASDMLLALCLSAYSAVSIGNYQLTVEAWVILTGSTAICFNSSVNFLLVIALDRLCYIAYHRNYRRLMTNLNIGILIFLCWFVALIPVFPVYTGVAGTCKGRCQCYRDQPLECPDLTCSNIVKGFTKSYMFGLVFYFLIMFIAISAIYALLFWKVHKQAHRVRKHSTSESTSTKSRRSKMRREFKLARTLGIVIIVFFACWSPLMLLYLVDYGLPGGLKMDQMVVLAIMSPAVMNSIMNPIIYAARIPFMKRYFCCCFERCKEKVVTTEGSFSNRKATNTHMPPKRKDSKRIGEVKSSIVSVGKDVKPDKKNDAQTSCSSHFTNTISDTQNESSYKTETNKSQRLVLPVRNFFQRIRSVFTRNGSVESSQVEQPISKANGSKAVVTSQKGGDDVFESK